MKRKQKLQKALIWLLILSLATGSIFAPSPIVKAKTVELRNNPFTYHYEETPLSFVGTYKINDFTLPFCCRIDTNRNTFSIRSLSGE